MLNLSLLGRSEIYRRRNCGRPFAKNSNIELNTILLKSLHTALERSSEFTCSMRANTASALGNGIKVLGGPGRVDKNHEGVRAKGRSACFLANIRSDKLDILEFVLVNCERFATMRTSIPFIHDACGWVWIGVYALPVIESLVEEKEIQNILRTTFFIPLQAFSGQGMVLNGFILNRDCERSSSSAKNTVNRRDERMRS